MQFLQTKGIPLGRNDIRTADLLAPGCIEPHFAGKRRKKKAPEGAFDLLLTELI
jgi:hypothetical protein